MQALWVFMQQIYELQIYTWDVKGRMFSSFYFCDLHIIDDSYRFGFNYKIVEFKTFSN